jgi:hypothetical protein
LEQAWGGAASVSDVRAAWLLPIDHHFFGAKGLGKASLPFANI